MPLSRTPQYDSDSQEPLFGGQPVPETVEASSFIDRDPKASMQHFLQCMAHLSKSNVEGGFQIAARGLGDLRSYERTLEWAEGDHDDLLQAADFKEGKDVSELARAWKEYRWGAQNLAGKKIPEDDLTLTIGFMKFYAQFGVANWNVKERRKARTDLQKAIDAGDSTIPINTFYDPDNTIYSSSKIDRHHRQPWEAVARSIGLGSSRTEATYLSPELATLFDDGADEMEAPVLLTDREKKLESEIAKLQPYDLGERTKRLSDDIGAFKQALRGQSDVLDQLKSATSESPHRDFEISDTSIKTVVENIIPDIAAVISRNYGLFQHESEKLKTELIKGLFSEDANRANSVAQKMFWIIETRIERLGHMTSELQRFARRIGGTAVSGAE